MSALKSLFGPSQKEIWRQLSREVDGQFQAPRHSEWVGVDERLRMLDVPPMLSGDPQHTRRTTP